MTNIIIKFFIKNNTDLNNSAVRKAYGNLGGLIGIFVNAFLFLLKFIIGLISGSIAITADAFNNLSDTASSIITIIGFKLANKPADKEHPFGHQKIESIAALLVCCMIIMMGLEFAKISFNRIINPNTIVFEWISFILLLVSICSKFWLFKFNKYVGELINSSSLKAASQDAIGDVFVTITVVVSYLVSGITSMPVDGYMGMLVSIGILFNGIKAMKETISPLIGEAPSEEVVKSITENVLKYDGVLGYHDLIVHTYGAGMIMASIHVEVPCNEDIIAIHNIIDRMEKEISKELNIHLVVHMDPVVIDDEEILEYKQIVLDVIENYDVVKSMHDFRMVDNVEIKNLIFDIVVNSNEFKNESDIENLINLIYNDVKNKNNSCCCMINVDLDFM